jgi:hypothetical protein
MLLELLVFQREGLISPSFPIISVTLLSVDRINSFLFKACGSCSSSSSYSKNEDSSRFLEGMQGMLSLHDADTDDEDVEDDTGLVRQVSPARWKGTIGSMVASS